MERNMGERVLNFLALARMGVSSETTGYVGVRPQHAKPRRKLKRSRVSHLPRGNRRHRRHA